MNKITVCVGGKDFDIKLEGAFAEHFEEEFQAQFKGKSTLDPKEVLLAYVGKCYEKFILEEEISHITKKLDTL
jgi:hypothetical protein